MPVPWMAVLSLALLYLAYNVLPTLLAPLLTPLRRLPGPSSPNWFWGHLREFRGDAGTLAQSWIAKYGHVLRFKLILNVRHVHLLSKRGDNLKRFCIPARSSSDHGHQGFEPYLDPFG